MGSHGFNRKKKKLKQLKELKMEKNSSALLLHNNSSGDKHWNKTKLQKFFTESASNAVDRKSIESSQTAKISKTVCLRFYSLRNRRLSTLGSIITRFTRKFHQNFFTNLPLFFNHFLQIPKTFFKIFLIIAQILKKKLKFCPKNFLMKTKVRKLIKSWLPMYMDGKLFTVSINRMWMARNYLWMKWELCCTVGNELADTIFDCGYSMNQIFDADEIGQNYKMLPSEMLAAASW